MDLFIFMEISKFDCVERRGTCACRLVKLVVGKYIKAFNDYETNHIYTNYIYLLFTL